MNLRRVRPEDYFTPAYFVGMYGFHIIISNSYSPLRYSFPLSVADKSYSAAQVPGRLDFTTILLLRHYS